MRHPALIYEGLLLEGRAPAHDAWRR